MNRINELFSRKHHDILLYISVPEVLHWKEQQQ